MVHYGLFKLAANVRVYDHLRCKEILYLDTQEYPKEIMYRNLDI